MTWFTENPFWICATGLFLGICLLFFFAQTKKKGFAILAGVSILVALTALLTSIFIVTDSEAIRKACRQLASAISNDDTPQTMKYISRSTDVYERAEREMNRYQFSRCWILSMSDVEVEEVDGVRRARVDVLVLVTANDTGQGLGGTARVQLNLTFDKESDGKWRVGDYSYRIREEREY